jgi:MurNAc alpha-1-phosphate uridylyltransferase
MKVMILAAGRGERMGHLTENCPKPLLKVAGRPLIEHHILALKQYGFDDFVINVAYLGDQIKSALGSGERWGVSIEYSDEGDQALETGGGIYKALPLLGDEPFLVVNADVWTDFPYDSLIKATTKDIHLVLVNNPLHHQKGDFGLLDGVAQLEGDELYTYSGIGVFRAAIFTQQMDGAFPLAPIIRQSILSEQVSAQLYHGEWVDVGTPERLANLENKRQ